MITPVTYKGRKVQIASESFLGYQAIWEEESGEVLFTKYFLSPVAARKAAKRMIDSRDIQ